MPDHDAIIERLRAAGCVFAEDEARLLVDGAQSAAELDAMVEERAAGIPLEQILGWAEFCGVRVAVEPGVFVPRRRSEFLVETAVTLAPAAPVVVDMCCGTGALAVALLAALRAAEVHAVEIDPTAVRCARRNLPGSQVWEGDLFAPLPRTLHARVDLLLANAPYVPTDAVAMMPPEARDHEHRIALDGGSDGLDVQRRLIAEAPGWLSPHGHLLVETSRRQVEQTLAAMRVAGLTAWSVSDDERGSTVAVGRQGTTVN